MRRTIRLQTCCGFTLIEVVVTLLVLGIAATTVFNVYLSTVKTSADPVLQQQALSIAEAYMEEILAQAFNDPDSTESGSAESGETRASFDDIQDYNGLPDSVVRDQNGNAIASLGEFSVMVSVAAASLSGVASGDAMRIDVTVSHAAIDDVLMSGFRSNY